MHSHAVPSDESVNIAPETELPIPWQRRGPQAIPATAEIEATAVLPGVVRAPAQRVDRVSVVLLFSDLIAVLCAWAVVPLPTGATVVLVLGFVAALAANRLYTSRLTLSVFDDLPVLAAAVPAVVGVVALTAGDPGLPGSFLLNGGLTFVLIVAGRSAAYAGIRFARKKGWVTYRTLIVGSGRTGARVGRLLQEHPEHGLRVVGFVGDRDTAVDGVGSRVVEEDCRRMVEAAEDHHARVVLVALSDVRPEEILRVLRGRESQVPFTLFVVPQLHELLLHRARNERLGHMAVLRLRASAFEAIPWQLKRTGDILMSAVAIALLAPVLAFIAAAVRLQGRDVFFRQTRVGRGGSPFVLYKFRSLRPLDEAESAERWSVLDEERITRLGRFLRKSSLDELPQLFNILKGDMSLVGPRPERPHFVAQFGEMYDWYSCRHRVRPGLTGWAAVNGLRGDTSIEDRCLYDNAYIDNWTLWLDVKILARTVTAVVRGEGG